MMITKHIKSKKECKDKESMQSSTTPDQDTIWVSDKNSRKYNTQENQDVSPF